MKPGLQRYGPSAVEGATLLSEAALGVLSKEEEDEEVGAYHPELWRMSWLEIKQQGRD